MARGLPQALRLAEALELLLEDVMDGGCGCGSCPLPGSSCSVKPRSA